MTGTPDGIPQAATEAAVAEAFDAWCDRIYPPPREDETGFDIGEMFEAFRAGAERGRADERQRIRPLLLALHRLYQIAYHEVGTVEIDYPPGYNGISYDDDTKISDAGAAIEALIADGDFADLLAGDVPAGEGSLEERQRWAR
jgi:hypothetical protein